MYRIMYCKYFQVCNFYAWLQQLEMTSINFILSSYVLISCFRLAQSLKIGRKLDRGIIYLWYQKIYMYLYNFSHFSICYVRILLILINLFPIFLFEGEKFWGHDRIPLLEERLTERGLRRPAA